MFNQTNVGDTLSDNNIASGNFSQNTLANFNVDFKGLEKSVGLLIPSVRNAMVERYRAETTYLILEKAIKIIKDNGLEIKAIPPKIALPLFDKLSIEHEEDMYEIWAKLLVSSSLNYDPISIYYADILSKIGSKEAKLLLEMYKTQTQYVSFMAYNGRMKKYSEELEYQNTARFIFKSLQVTALDTLSYIRKCYNIPKPVYIKLKHCFKKLTTKAERDFRGYANDLYDMAMPFNKPECSHSLEILSSVGLVLGEPREMPVLTKLGYDMVRTLERDSKEKLCLNLKSTKRKH